MNLEAFNYICYFKSQCHMKLKLVQLSSLLTIPSVRPHVGVSNIMLFIEEYGFPTNAKKHHLF